MTSNQIIKGIEIPMFNGVRGFAAYLLVKTGNLKIPCVYYLAAHIEHETCLANLRILDQCSVTYPFLRNKLSEENIKNIKVGVTALLSEFNSGKSNMFS